MELMLNEQGELEKYDNTYDLTIHCESKEEQEEILNRLSQQWIPCSERLPEENGFYLATCDGEICGENEPFTGLAEYENGKWVDDEEDYQCVLAWMPLPEPYESQERRDKE